MVRPTDETFVRLFAPRRRYIIETATVLVALLAPRGGMAQAPLGTAIVRGTRGTTTSEEGTAVRFEVIERKGKPFTYRFAMRDLEGVKSGDAISLFVPQLKCDRNRVDVKIRDCLPGGLGAWQRVKIHALVTRGRRVSVEVEDQLDLTDDKSANTIELERNGDWCVARRSVQKEHSPPATAAPVDPESPGSIRGKLVSPDGSPVEGLIKLAYGGGGGRLDDRAVAELKKYKAAVRPDGWFEITKIRPGSYAVLFYPACENCARTPGLSGPIFVEVEAGKRTNLDVIQLRYF